MSAWSYLAARASRWMSPRSSNPSRRSSEAKAAENPTSPRRASRTSIKLGRPRNDSNGPFARNLGPRADDMDLGAWRRRIREYDEITNVGPIIRRYFVIGAFDGALTVLGIIIGAYPGGASEAHKALILSASIGAAIALAVSSPAGAHAADRLAAKLYIRMVDPVIPARRREEHDAAFQFAAILSALVHGVAPLL